MTEGLRVVLDAGKSLAKITLWDRGGRLIARETRRNSRVEAGGYRVLDVAGIEEWMAVALGRFARHGRIEAIVPVGHGAAAAIIRDGALVLPPLDYEDEVSAADRAAYNLLRDGFAQTGSTSLPGGLNLGVQLFRLERENPGLFDGASLILPWPQYWAWVLAGIPAAEITSLGCHSDLWCPGEAQPSSLARNRGWSKHLAPLRKAWEVLGTIRPEWAERTGLAEDVRIYCGIHDSNAALLAARGFPEVAHRESTVLSTGTWFVTMRSPGPGTRVDIARLPQARDCLVNVDALGQPVPSARFMGGREIEMLTGRDARCIDFEPAQSALLAAVDEVVCQGVMVLPSFAPGYGPFPQSRGRWIDAPSDPIARGAAICLYSALVADVCLDLVGARERVVVEGRFAAAEVFVRALASLRPNDRLYASSFCDGVSCGALRLIDPASALPAELRMVVPLDVDLEDYKGRWRNEAGRSETSG